MAMEKISKDMDCKLPWIFECHQVRLCLHWPRDRPHDLPSNLLRHLFRDLSFDPPRHLLHELSFDFPRHLLRDPPRDRPRNIIPWLVHVLQVRSNEEAKSRTLASHRKNLLTKFTPT